MHFSDFLPDRKSKMAARGRFSEKNSEIFFCPKINLEYISGHFGQKKKFLFKKNFPAIKLRKFSGFLIFFVLDIFLTFLDLEQKLFARVH